MARAIGLGCMRLSTEAARPDATAARAIIDAAITAGVLLVDTADVYCHSDADLGHNERADKGFAARAGIRYHDVREGWPHPSTMDS